MIDRTNQVLALSGVSKAFPGVKALDRVTFDVTAGEVHGLVGENGAGKSTLMAIASGALTPNEGSVRIAGVETRGDPERARALGLAIVRQEPSLMPDLTVAENLFLGLPPQHRPSLPSMNARAGELLLTWSSDVTIDPTDRVISLNPEQRFIVEIVKALAAQPKVLLLDEPTEHLPADDVERLFQRIRGVTAKGTAVVYISHRIREVQGIADRLTVLRDGMSQGPYAARALDEQQIVELIVGGVLDREFPEKASNLRDSPTLLEVSGLTGHGFSDATLSVRRGEILGLAGIDANGQREFMRALAGLHRSHGAIRIDGRAVVPSDPNKAAAGGIRYLPGDRHREGILAELSVRQNFSLRSLTKDLAAGFVNPRSEMRRAQAAVSRFAVKTPDIETPIGSLSGGNQQKVILASVLASEPTVLLVDEPTQGVDVGARMEIYKILRAFAENGAAVIVVSSDAQEVAGLSDRVMVFSRGHIVHELAGEAVSEHNITSAVLTSTSVRDHPRGGAHGFWKWAAGDWAPLATVALVVLLLGFYASIASEFYLTARNLTGVLTLVATLALVSYGQQMLMLVGGIDLSVGPLMGLAQVVASFFLLTDVPPEYQILGWLLLFAVAIGVGLINWVLVDPVGLHPMVATLATFMAVQAVSLLLRPVPEGLIAETVLDRIGTTIGAVPVTLIAAVCLAMALEYALFRSECGLAFRGLGSRPEAARVVGVPPRLTQLAAYVGCSLFGGVAGITMMGQVGIGDPNSGIGYTLMSIAAVVVGGASLFGGRGSFIGALLGALLITQVNSVTTFLNLNDAWQSYLLGGMILAAVALYSKSRQKAGIA